ncbi:unnamed protein product [Mytilus edulis]|uniref:Reverse transcriptase domain-containing protein n=1 Tax=Mytilus edulis TaxID=6550 RepID=A0A8S3UT64_MYTED|nr:unnamed protein product [Mytilus edulis]
MAKSIDHLIKPLSEGSEKMQCIEILSNSAHNLLLVSVYLPSKGSRDHVEEFLECIDQLYELYQKYYGTHDIIIGGDLNEDLNDTATSSKRNRYLRNFISECNLSFNNAGKTFIKASGVECSELDYFLHTLKDPKLYSNKTVLHSVKMNVSDHHPVQMTCVFDFAKVTQKQRKSSNVTPKIKWDKMDMDLYKAMVDTSSKVILEKLANNQIGLEESIQTTCEIMANSAIKSSNIKPSYNAKPKLKVWTPAIQVALKEMRNSYNAWVKSGKHEDLDNVLFLEKRRTKQLFRKSVRVEIAKRREDEKELIMETRTRNMKLFHRLVRNTRFKEHFRTLATYDENINIDNDYHQNVEHEIHIINQLVKGKNIPDASREEISNAIKNINKGKSADYYGITIEHIVNAGEIMVILLQSIINEIFQQGYVPDLLKIGLLTPIFKNKGSKNDAGNYRGITVLPVVSKIIDTVLKNRTQPSVKAVQHKYQRGFTSGSGPMNSALPVEEVYREVHDGETEAQIILLDAKSAFDKVIHTHMMRRVYQAGIEDKHWSLISSLHQNAATPKSVALNLLSKTHKKNNTNECIFNIGNNVMPNVKQALHLGIIRTTSMKENVTLNVEENIKKARRSAYGLFGGGFHGHNGLDPETLVHLFKTYISPVLLYGMELLLPKNSHATSTRKIPEKITETAAFTSYINTRPGGVHTIRNTTRRSAN